MRKRGGNIASNVYDGAAEFGRFMALIGLIIGCLIGVVMLIGGIALFFKKNKYTKIVSGKVTKAQCNNINNSISCTITAEYTVNNKSYTIENIMNGKRYYSPGDTIEIYYDPTDPGLSSTNKPFSFAIIGGILIGIALLIIGGVALNYYIATRFKFAAAANGVGNIVDIAT